MYTFLGSEANKRKATILKKICISVDLPSIPAVFIRKSGNFFARPLFLRRPGLIFSREDLHDSASKAFQPCRTLVGNFLSNITKNQPLAVGLMIFQQCSIFPGRRQPSIFDDEKLNFCVRNVNRWILFSIATGNGITSSFHLELPIFTLLLYLISPQKSIKYNNFQGFLIKP